MSTESRNPQSLNLDALSAVEIVALMNKEERAVLDALESCEGPLGAFIEQTAKSYAAGGRVIYLAAGTSGRIAAMDAAEMPPTFGIETDRFMALFAGGATAQTKAVETAEDDATESVAALVGLGIGSNDVVIGISASGTTPYVLAGLQYAKERGALTCGIANNPQTPILKECDHPILLETGPEVLTGSTRLKAGTAQKLVLNRISTAVMVLNGYVISNLMVGVKASNQKLRERCVRIVCELSSMRPDEAREALEANDWNVKRALGRD